MRGAVAAPAISVQNTWIPTSAAKRQRRKSKGFHSRLHYFESPGWFLCFYHALLRGWAPGDDAPSGKLLVWEKGGRHLQVLSLREATSKILELSTGFKTRRPFKRTSYKNKQLNLPQPPLYRSQLFVWRRISRKLCSTSSLDLRSQHVKNSQCSPTNDELCQAHINT